MKRQERIEALAEHLWNKNSGCRLPWKVATTNPEYKNLRREYRIDARNTLAFFESTLGCCWRTEDQSLPKNPYVGKCAHDAFWAHIEAQRTMIMVGFVKVEGK